MSDSVSKIVPFSLSLVGVFNYVNVIAPAYAVLGVKLCPSLILGSSLLPLSLFPFERGSGVCSSQCLVSLLSVAKSFLFLGFDYLICSFLLAFLLYTTFSSSMNSGFLFIGCCRETIPVCLSGLLDRLFSK